MMAFSTWNGKSATACPYPMIPLDASGWSDEQPLQQYQTVRNTANTDNFTSFPTEQMDPSSAVMRENDGALEGGDELACEGMFSQQQVDETDKAVNGTVQAANETDKAADEMDKAVSEALKAVDEALKAGDETANETPDKTTDEAAPAFDLTGWTQPTEIRCPVPKRPFMIPPRQISSGGLLSPGDANTTIPRPWGQPNITMQIAQSSLASQAISAHGGQDSGYMTNNNFYTPPSSPILSSDVARIMSPCQRSLLKRYDRRTRLGTWKRLNPPYEAINADNMYEELRQEVLEGRRYQRERELWLARYLKGTKTRATTAVNTNADMNTSMNAGVNPVMNPVMSTGVMASGVDTFMQDTLEPFGMPSEPPASMWFPGLAGPAATFHGYLSVAGEATWQQPQAAAFIPNGQAVWGAQMSQEMYWHHMDDKQPILYDFGTTSDVMWPTDTAGENGGFYGAQRWA